MHYMYVISLICIDIKFCKLLIVSKQLALIPEVINAIEMPRCPMPFRLYIVPRRVYNVMALYRVTARVCRQLIYIIYNVMTMSL